MNYHFFLFTPIIFNFMLHADPASVRTDAIQYYENGIRYNETVLSEISALEKRIKTTIAEFPDNYYELPLDSKLNLTIKFIKLVRQLSTDLLAIGMYESSKKFGEFEYLIIETLKTAGLITHNLYMTTRSLINLLKTSTNIEQLASIIKKIDKFREENFGNPESYEQKVIVQSIYAFKEKVKNTLAMMTREKAKWEGKFYYLTAYLPVLLKSYVDSTIFGGKWFINQTTTTLRNLFQHRP